MTTREAFLEWFHAGQDAGFCELSVCGFHDGTMHEEEIAELVRSGVEPCYPIVRLTPPPETAEADR